MSQLSALRNLRQILEEEEQRSREDDEQEKMSWEKFRNRHPNFRAINSRNEIADRQRYAISSGSILRIDGIDDRPYITSDFLDRPANRVYTNGGTACNYYKSNGKYYVNGEQNNGPILIDGAKVKNPNEKVGGQNLASETALQHHNSAPTNGKQVSEAAHDIGAAEAAKVKNPNKIEGGHKATQTALQHHNSVPTNGKQVHDIGEATEMLKKEGAAKVKMPKEKEGEHKLATQTHNYGQTGLNTDYKLSVALKFDELNRKIARLEVPASTHITHQIHHAEYVTFIQGDWVRQSNDNYELEFHLHGITDGRKRPGTKKTDELRS